MVGQKSRMDRGLRGLGLEPSAVNCSSQRLGGPPGDPRALRLQNAPGCFLRTKQFDAFFSPCLRGAEGRLGMSVARGCTFCSQQSVMD